jgi:SRSO17 transposase
VFCKADLFPITAAQQNKTSTRVKFHVSRQLLAGLFQVDKKIMERMEGRVSGPEYDPLQYFLSDSNWDWCPLYDQIARDGDRLLRVHNDSALYLEESALPKKGRKSVGVARQWCGQLGKIYNCQVTVFATLGKGNFCMPIDYRLYLPEEWTKDRKRWKKLRFLQTRSRSKPK